MNSRKDCSSIALAALPGHSRFARLVRVREYFALLCTCVSFEKSQLILVRKGSDIIAIDHAIIRSIMCGSSLNFFTRQSLEILTDRTTKVAKTVSVYEKLTFQSIVVGAGFERQERQGSFRA